MIDSFVPETGTFDGVWYGCGTENTIADRQYVYAGGKATYSAWHQPMAVYAPAVNRTFFAFGDARNRPCISVYDHATGRFAPPRILGENDDMNAHRNPTIHIDEEGYVYAFYGYVGGGQHIHLLRSVKPYDIEAWTRRTDMTEGGGSYAQPWRLEPGSIFVSYRQAEGWGFRTTRDGGMTWEPPVQVVRFEREQSYSTAYGIMAAGPEPYPRRIHFVWSKLGGGTPEEVATKHLWARRYNLYHARSDDGGGTWRRTDGSVCELPITEATADRQYDSGTNGIWIKDVKVDPDGAPVVLFLEADAATYTSVWRFGRCREGAWTFADVTTTDHMYDGGALAILGTDDYRVYGPTKPVQPHMDGGEIEEWQSVDQGRTWRRVKVVTSNSRFSHNHVKVALNHEQSDGAFRAFWSYADGRTPPEDKRVRMYCYGEDKGVRWIALDE
ncbi:MAG: hypothetical protein GY851_16695 [bacterium]|nr:hypothetical protein [bacterium]